MLLTREQVLAQLGSERMLRHRVASGELMRVHRGFYVDGAMWRDLWPEGRLLLRVLAAHAAAPAPGPLFTHLSAAVILGLPLYRVATLRVDVARENRGHTRSDPGIVRHDMKLDPEDVVVVDGLRCTSIVRTVSDLARTVSVESAVAAADAALRRVAVRNNEQDADLAGEWREAQLRLAATAARGVRQARWVAGFADGRAQLPGESVSRVHLHRLGFREVQLQVPVIGAEGDQYFLDFGFPGARAFGEFDGRDKYLDADLRIGDAEAAVLAEKRREDDVRGVTGWRFGRWAGEHIVTADRLGRRLAAFRIFPPG